MSVRPLLVLLTCVVTTAQDCADDPESCWEKPTPQYDSWQGNYDHYHEGSYSGYSSSWATSESWRARLDQATAHAQRMRNEAQRAEQEARDAWSREEFARRAWVEAEENRLAREAAAGRVAEEARVWVSRVGCTRRV